MKLKNNYTKNHLRRIAFGLLTKYEPLECRRILLQINQDRFYSALSVVEIDDLLRKATIKGCKYEC